MKLQVDFSLNWDSTYNATIEVIEVGKAAVDFPTSYIFSNGEVDFINERERSNADSFCISIKYKSLDECQAWVKDILKAVTTLVTRYRSARKPEFYTVEI